MTSLHLRASATALSFLLLACGDPSGPPGDASTGEPSTTAEPTTGATTAGPPTTSSGDTSSGDPGAGDTSSGGPGTGGVDVDPRLAECLRINACEADGGAPIGLQACLGHALDVPWAWATTGQARLALEAMDCKLAASDCEGVRACTPAVEQFADACADHPFDDTCAGDTWVFCDENGAPTAAMDCAAAGLGCNKEIWAGCGADPCEFGVTEATCDGDTLVECDASGLLRRIDCPTQSNIVFVNGMEGEMVYSIAGEVCGFDEMRGSNGCIGTGEACGFFSQACDGDVLETCAGGRLSRRDCATLEPAGQGCGFIQSGPFGGAASCGLVAPACDLAADEACDGGVIRFCDWDTPGEIDCGELGYSGCQAGEHQGRTVAWCTP